MFTWAQVDRRVATVKAVVACQHHDACDGGVLTAKGFVIVTRDAEVMFFFVRIVIVALDTGLPVRGGWRRESQ